MTEQEAIDTFRKSLPGWWWSGGVCSVSSHASCGPDYKGPDEHLLKNSIFDDGFHADPAQPSTFAEALMNVMQQGLEARKKALEVSSEYAPISCAPEAPAGEDENQQRGKV